MAIDIRITQAEIDELNKRAVELRRADPTATVPECLRWAAEEAGLTELPYPEDEYGQRPEDPDVVLFQAADGRRVNCWLVGSMSEEIEDGGAGFDDQIGIIAGY